jgi:hypothetical protein
MRQRGVEARRTGAAGATEDLRSTAASGSRRSTDRAIHDTAPSMTLVDGRREVRLDDPLDARARTDSGLGSSDSASSRRRNVPTIIRSMQPWSTDRARAPRPGSSWAHLSLAVVAALAFAGMCSVATYAYLDDRAGFVERR